MEPIKASYPTLDERRWRAAAREGRLWRCSSDRATWTLRQCAERTARVVAGLADAAIAKPHAGL
jgi:hypothetical protein